MKTVKKMVFCRSFDSIAHSQKKSFKKGFSLIELVLAIVIVAITLASLPKIVSQTQKSNELAIKQELTYSAKTLMGRIVSMPWDSTALRTMCENDGRICDSNGTIRSYLRNKNIRIPIYNSVPLNGRSGPGSRPGSLIANNNAYVNQNRISSADRSKTYTPGDNSYGFNDGGNDIDDFRGTLATRNEQVSNEDFISDMLFVTEVDYVSGTISGGTTLSFSTSDKGSPINGGVPTNIKRVKVTVEDTAGDPGTGEYRSTMYFYAPNIGMNKPMVMSYKGM
ncbi:type II secretion system protein [Campylobacter ureolyticus]|uniref:type II secretion system protein n=1 Tax=Campylobacter ureolyticus TaxID=827 RepID=UPI0022B54858|nr:type II secretion system protein [Campylobacter ureolyticus]MCZ6150614.1 type II secretion system protein [Campylobacter ureolyticus]